MSRYPFTDCLNEYMPLECGHIASSTYATTRRKLVQLGKIFHELKQDGRVSTDNPRKITAKDIDAFVGYRKANGVVDATILKDLGILKKMLAYFDNDAISAFKSKYPAHYPKKYKRRAPAMAESVVDRILARAMEISEFDWKLSEAYGIVCLAICVIIFILALSVYQHLPVLLDLGDVGMMVLYGHPGIVISLYGLCSHIEVCHTLLELAAAHAGSHHLLRSLYVIGADALKHLKGHIGIAAYCSKHCGHLHALETS